MEKLWYYEKKTYGTIHKNYVTMEINMILQQKLRFTKKKNPTLDYQKLRNEIFEEIYRYRAFIIIYYGKNYGTMEKLCHYSKQ